MKPNDLSVLVLAGTVREAEQLKDKLSQSHIRKKWDLTVNFIRLDEIEMTCHQLKC